MIKIFLIGESREKYEIPIGEYIIGREDPESSANIKIRGRMTCVVSRKHCKIYNNGNALEVEDLKSMNGTYVNEEIIKSEERVLLNDKDELKLGRYTLKVKFTKESLLERLIKSFINKFFI